jgi:hypothetical protein
MDYGFKRAIAARSGQCIEGSGIERARRCRDQEDGYFRCPIESVSRWPGIELDIEVVCSTSTSRESIRGDGNGGSAEGANGKSLLESNGDVRIRRVEVPIRQKLAGILQTRGYVQAYLICSADRAVGAR